jgi:hypothetical protein
MNSVKQLKTVTKNVAKTVEAEISKSGGLLRLAPCWVPRSFLQPGKRLKLRLRAQPRRHRRAVVCQHHARSE